MKLPSRFEFSPIGHRASALMHTALLICLLFAACIGNAFATGACEQEVERANNTLSKIYQEWPLHAANDNVDAAVQTIASNIAARAGIRNMRRWRTHIVRDFNLNAFSIGDGHIFITEGMLRFINNDAELAALIAHEFGHHLAGHFCRAGNHRRGFWSAFFGSDEPENDAPPQSRKQIGSLTALVDPELEREADRIGVNILNKAGLDAHAALTLAIRMSKTDSNAHFQYAHRIEALKDLLATIPHREADAENAAAFRKMKSALTER
jgi:predicted Zn-dependent protease